MKPFFSIIIGFRNRDLKRVQHALDSLASQSYRHFELIFIDYGSDQADATKTQELVEAYSFATYYYHNSTGWYWNRSHALNLGIEKANAEVLLIYDIDLVIEDDFLQKISVLNYEDQFYTFSCFYLPEHFDVANKQLAKDGVHYEQNYVGLCAAKKQIVESIEGFDEYFMVWGGEDDDFYYRLSSVGLQRKQLPATQYAVFHQWHPTQSPGKPSLWYFTMVNYLFSKKTKGIGQQLHGTFLLKEDRPLLKLIAGKSYKNYTKLEFLPDFKLLFFNSFIQGFQQLPAKSIAFLEYELPQERKPAKSLFNFLTNKNDQQPEQINSKDINHFFEYFIGTNRQSLSDYYLEQSNNKWLFVCLKNELDYQKN